MNNPFIFEVAYEDEFENEIFGGQDEFDEMPEEFYAEMADYEDESARPRRSFKRAGGQRRGAPFARKLPKPGFQRSPRFPFDRRRPPVKGLRPVKGLPPFKGFPFPKRPRWPVLYPYPVAHPVTPPPPSDPGSGPPSNGTGGQTPTTGGQTPAGGQASSTGGGQTPSSGGESTPPDEGANRANEYARWVQSTLNRVLGLDLQVDGVMNDQTRQAVRSFQQKKGLPVDGIVGPPTERALIEAGSEQSPKSDQEPKSGPPKEDDKPESEFGSYGFFKTASGDFEMESEVNRRSADYAKWVQESLNKVMGLQLKVDGNIGKATRSALRRFQQQKGIKADGQVGEQTERALIAAGAKRPPQTSGGGSGSGIPGVSRAVASCPPPPELTPAEKTVLAVTTYFETGVPFSCRVSKVDGISMGMIQWNLKAGTLQNLVRDFEKRGGRLETYLGSEAAGLRALLQLSKSETVTRAKNEQLATRWMEGLLKLCGDPIFCRLMAESIKNYYLRLARAAARRLNLRTVRGLSMMFDIVVGDGYGIPGKRESKLDVFEQRIRRRETSLGRALSEREKLSEIADEAAKFAGTYQDERRARRMVIAHGRGVYRKSNWDLDSLRLFNGQLNLDDPSGV